MKRIIFLLLTCFAVQAIEPDLTRVGSTELEQLLVDCLGNKRVGYFPNPGNAGDALIWYGTVCLFKKLGISHVLASPKSKDSGNIDVWVYGGGGNLVPYYANCSAFLYLAMKTGKPTLLLPQTIQGHNKLLSHLKPNVSLICRENMSYEYCKRAASYPNNVHLGFCLAFYSDVTPFYNKKKGKKEKHLFAFRGDREVNGARKSIHLPKGNQDISLKCGMIGKGSTSAQMYQVVEKFMNTIGKYDVVWTDRLHVGIAGFLLGKKVHLFDNSYGKNRAVYVSTIEKLDVQKRVEFHTDWSGLPS